MEILTYLSALRRRWPLVVTTVVLAVGIAYVSAPKRTLYEASSTIVVGPRQLTVDPARTDSSGSLTVELANLTVTYAALINSQVIAQEAIRRTGVPRSPGEVVAATKASAVPATQVLRVSVVDRQPAVAQALATEMANAFVERVTSAAPGTSPPVGSAPAVPVYLYQPAGLPVAQPQSRRVRVATAGVFGLLAAIGAALLLDYLDVSIRSSEEAERRLDLPVLGTIPLLMTPAWGGSRRHRNVVAVRVGGRPVRGPRAAEASTEALRVLRNNLLVAVADVEHPVVVVTSAKPLEGKTAVTAGLARSLASTGRRVVVVDLDLRRPQLHERLGAANQIGVVDVVALRAPLADALQVIEPPPGDRAGGKGLSFLGSGQPVANPTELLGTPALAQLVESIASQADIVLVDSAPVLPVADTLVMAKLATGVVLVVEAGRTSEKDIRAGHVALTRNGVRVIGVALNKLDAREVQLGYGRGGGRLADLDLDPDPSGELPGETRSTAPPSHS